MIFETPRLQIRKATTSDDDIEMYFQLWNHPDVMVNVGFPNGLGISREEVIQSLQKHNDPVYNGRLVVERKNDNNKIGECKLGLPDENGVSETDVKLFPQYWSMGYGKEIKKGLVNYLFTNNKDCQAVKADPKINNIASQKMQESVNAIRIETDKQYPIADIEKYRPAEGHYLYMAFRCNWKR